MDSKPGIGPRQRTPEEGEMLGCHRNQEANMRDEMRTAAMVVAAGLDATPAEPQDLATDTASGLSTG
ncbi:MAG: hypothetical protein U1D26_03495 [Patescibacteria group bacterium]|nr:hypothetical protein [bacterium]MDZ4227515.1 hypothetical protein [Patescibacteria group bacterium]